MAFIQHGTNMKSLQDILSWSKEEIELQEFCSNRQNKLPAIVFVTNGYYGVNDQTFGAEEIFYVFGFERQKRLIVKDKRENTYSIPVDYEVKFHHLRRNSSASNLPPSEKLKEIVDRWTVNPEQRWIAAENNVILHFNVDAKLQKCESLGILEIQEIFELKYAMAHSMSETATSFYIDATATPIPDYMNISITKAIGFADGDYGGYINWLQDLADQVASFDHKSSTLCKEIIQFKRYKHGQNACHYEYIRIPALDMSNDGVAYTPLREERNFNDESPYAEIDVNISRKATCQLPLPEKIKKTVHKKVSLPPLPINISPRLSNVDTKITRTPSTLNKRRVPTPIKDLCSEDSTMCTDDMKNVLTTDPCKTSNGDQRQQQPPQSGSAEWFLSNQKTEVPLPVRRSTIYNNNLEKNPVSKERRPQSSANQNTYTDYNNNFKNLQSGLQASLAKRFDNQSLKNHKSLLSYKHHGDIPKNVTWSKVNTEEILHLLSLLGITKSKEKFLSQNINGDHLLNVIDDETILVEDFDFNESEAHILLEFIQKDWRPEQIHA